ncbi:hypothetical protein CEXT_171351 [Caerostris extrusa]|uniref:Uncharacterized protein n=1 Tax=Caerostris extrusa TaxID=172846 RepID=A0AAV4Y4D5_CAEEX|nr:hypothetical protein CEXT_171351 [Caerostris extrusa]
MSLYSEAILQLLAVERKVAQLAPLDRPLLGQVTYKLVIHYCTRQWYATLQSLTRKSLPLSCNSIALWRGSEPPKISMAEDGCDSL